MNKTLTLILSLVSSILYAQPLDCEDLLKKPLAISRCGAEPLDSCLVYDLERIYACAEFAPIDKFILKPVVLASQLKSYIGYDSLSYSDMITSYNDFLHSASYRKIKEFKLSFDAFENLTLNNDNWERFTKHLAKAGYNETELDSLRGLFKPNLDSSISFLDAYLLARNPDHTPSSENKILSRSNRIFEHLELSLEISKRTERPALIYFFDLNLSDPSFQSLTRSTPETEEYLDIISSYYDLYYAATQMTTELNEFEKIAYVFEVDRPIQKGAYATQIKNQLSPSNSPGPLVVILNQDGSVRAIFQNLDQPEEFKEFLNNNKRSTKVK